jgi:hypothetical protein
VLTEFKQVRQEPGADTHRRWFETDGMELVVWYAPSGGPVGFQLCYMGADRRERALTWQEGQGFSHARVDSGDTRPEKNLTPILVRDGAVSWSGLRERFAAVAGGLDADMRDFVVQRLELGGA